MLRARVAAAAGGHADDDRAGALAAEHVAELGDLVDDLVEAHRRQVGEHDLCDGAHAAERGARRGADDRRLGDRRVDDALAAVLAVQALRDAEHAADLDRLSVLLEAADILADEEHPRVPLELVVQGLVQRIAHALDGHVCRLQR